MQVTVWTKSGSKICEQVIKQLNRKSNVTVTENNITVGPLTKADLIAAAPNAKTVPQIFVDGTYIGGIKEFAQRTDLKASPSDFKHKVAHTHHHHVSSNVHVK